MLARIDLRGSALPGTRDLAGLLPRAGTDIDSVMATVRPLCEDVRIRGAQAVREITARLDGVDAAHFAVPQAALDRALAEPGPHLIEALVPSEYTSLRLKVMPRALNALEKLPRPLARAAKRKFYP